MTAPLMQNPIDAVHERFSQGGSISHFLIVLGVIGVALAALFIVNYWQRRREDNVVEDNPKRLYRDLLRELGLGVVRRDLMLKIARELRLEHPAILVMGPRPFRTHVQQWLRETGDAGSGNAEHELDGLCEELFGESLNA